MQKDTIYIFSEEYKSDFRKFARKEPLHMIVFLTV